MIAIAPLTASASAAPPPPAALHVFGGEGWQADDSFSVGWTNPAAIPPVAAVHYRVKNPEGVVESAPTRVGWPAEHVWVSVTGRGAHTLEVWLEDTAGAEGPTADVKLRFDDARPGGMAPIQPPDWIGRTELPYPIGVTHPSGPPPLAGIRGYALSVDRAPAGTPCVGTFLCSDAETDLRGGAGDDRLLVELPEGTSHVHAVAVSGSQVHSLATGHATLRVDRTDPITRLAGNPLGWTNRPVLIEASASDSLSGMTPAGGGEPFTAIRVDDAAPTVAPGDSVRATVVATGIHTLSYYARDAAGNVNDGSDSNGQPNAPPLTVPLRIDRDPPSVVFTGSAHPRDPELIEARVSDRLSGPDPELGEIGVRPAGSTDPWEPLPTLGAGDTLLARWRSDDFPFGEYEFRVVGRDAAGKAGESDQAISAGLGILSVILPPGGERSCGQAVMPWPRTSDRRRRRR